MNFIDKPRPVTSTIGEFEVAGDQLCVGGVGRGAQFAGVDAFADQFGNTFFDDRRDSVVDHADFLVGDINADDLMTESRKTGARHQPHITQAENGNLFRGHFTPRG